MIGSILAGAAGLASTIAGAVKGRKEAKKQRQLQQEQQDREAEWYTRNYYRNHLDSAEAQSAIKRVNDTMARRNEEAAAAAKINGATPEAVHAQRSAAQDVIADTVAGMAVDGERQRSHVDAMHNRNQQQLLDQQQQLASANQAAGSAMIGNGAGLIGQALSLYGGKKDDTTTSKEV